MATIYRPEDLKLEVLDPAVAKGGTGDEIKLQVLAETAPYVHVTEVSAGYVIHPHSHSETEVTIVLTSWTPYQCPGRALSASSSSRCRASSAHSESA